MLANDRWNKYFQKGWSELNSFFCENVSYANAHGRDELYHLVILY